MKARVLKNVSETYKVKILHLELENKLDFIPGQFIFVEHKILKDGKEFLVKRPYSIASTPSNNKVIELVFDIKENGLVSKYLYNLEENQIIEISGPSGFFTFEDSIKEDIVLIGAGTGIVPLMGILRYITEKKLKNKLIMIFSCKTSRDFIYEKELNSIKNKNLKLFVTVTQDKNWKGLKERINIDMMKNIIKNFDNKIFYLCGPPLMVVELSKSLKNEGVDKSNIKIEAYE